MIVDIKNKFQIGDIVKAPRYNIEYGQIVTIETYFRCGVDFDIRGIDYDILHQLDTGEWDIDHISEGHIELI